MSMENLQVELFEVMSVKKRTTGELDVQAYPISAEEEECQPRDPLEFLDAFDWVIVEHDADKTTLFAMPMVLNLPVTNVQVSVHVEAEIKASKRFTADEQAYLTKRYERITVDEKRPASTRSATNVNGHPQ